MSELVREQCQNSSLLQANFISGNYATTFSFCEMARQDKSKSLKIITIGHLGAEIYGEQGLYLDFAHFEQKSHVQTFVQTAINNNSNLYECNISLNLLIYRLKLSELKLVACAHQIKHIKHSSKVKISELQKLIL